MSSKYTALLRDPRWQRKRLEIFERDNWSCTKCGEDALELHVHHKEYWPGRLPWEYPNQNFATLCAPCHKSGHFDTIHSNIMFPELVGHPIRGVAIPWTGGNDGYGCLEPMPWTGEIIDRGPKSEMPKIFVCVSKTGGEALTDDASARAFLFPEGMFEVNPVTFETWVDPMSTEALKSWLSSLVSIVKNGEGIA